MQYYDGGSALTPEPVYSAKPLPWEVRLNPSMQAVLTGHPRQVTCRGQNGLPMGPEAGDPPAACNIVTFKRCEPCISLNRTLQAVQT